MARLDSAILHEIVHVIQSREKVPERIRILKRQFQVSYLEDHRQRMEEALRRRDFDRLNMLFGQLASKVKYQVVRAVTAKAAKSTTPTGAKRSGPTTIKKPTTVASKRKAPSKKPTSARTPAKKAASKKIARSRGR